jgi:hypothetical protein
MKTKYLVCEICDNKMLGGSSYETLEDAVGAFCAVVFDYGVEASEEMIGAKIYDCGGCVVQIVEILDK